MVLLGWWTWEGRLAGRWLCVEDLTVNIRMLLTTEDDRNYIFTNYAQARYGGHRGRHRDVFVLTL